MVTTASRNKTKPGRVLSLPGTESFDPFGFEFARIWYSRLLETGTLVPPGPLYIPSAEMVEDALFFAKQGFSVKLGDGDKTALRAARETVKRGGGDLGAAFDKSLQEIKPWHLGTVGAIVDRTLFARLELRDRFSYANRVGRILAPGRPLVAVYRVGEQRDGAPHPIALDALQRTLLRYFSPEVFQLAKVPQPGHDQAWAAVLRRK